MYKIKYFWICIWCFNSNWSLQFQREKKLHNTSTYFI